MESNVFNPLRQQVCCRQIGSHPKGSSQGVLTRLWGLAFWEPLTSCTCRLILKPMRPGPGTAVPQALKRNGCSVAVESEEPRLLFHQFHGSELCADPTLVFFLGADESYTSELRPVSQIIALKSLASPVLSVSHFQASCKSAAWISSRYHRKSIIAWIYIFHPTIP